MGFMFGNVTGISFLVGFGLGFIPLASQAYGAGNMRRVGDLLQRQLMIHFLLVCIPIAVVWSKTEAILLYVHSFALGACVCLCVCVCVCMRVHSLTCV